MFKIPIILFVIFVLFILVADDKKPVNHFISGLLGLATGIAWLYAGLALLWRIP